MTPYAQPTAAASERRGAGRRHPNPGVFITPGVLAFRPRALAVAAGCCRSISAWPWRRVWRSCSAAPRRVKRPPVPCAFMLRHGKKATFPRRAGTRTLSVCGAPCSGAWTVVCGQGYRGIGRLRTGRWSRVASARAAARTVLLCRMRQCVRTSIVWWSGLAGSGKDRIVCTEHMCLPSCSFASVFVSFSLQHMETKEKSQMPFTIHVHSVEIFSV